MNNKNGADFKHGFARRLDLQGRSTFLEDFADENNSLSPKAHDDELDFDQLHSADSPSDPFEPGRI